MKRTLRSLGALVTVALAVAGCGTLTVNPIVQFVDDTSTTTAIKNRLAMEHGIRSLATIGVHTTNDVVRLTGTVADEAERQQVEAIARRIAGDNRVVSELRVASGTSASVSTEKKDGTAPQKPTVQKPTVEKPTVQKPTVQRTNTQK